MTSIYKPRPSSRPPREVLLLGGLVLFGLLNSCGVTMRATDPPAPPTEPRPLSVRWFEQRQERPAWPIDDAPLEIRGSEDS